MRYNFYFSGGEARIWLRLHPLKEDYELIECGKDIGTRHKWIDREVSEVGWGSIINPLWRSVESGLGWAFSEAFFVWALENAIVPKSPFLVHFEKPKYLGSHDDYEVRVDWHIVERTSQSNETLAKRWEIEIKRLRQYRNHAKEKMQKLIDKRRWDWRSMFIREDCYWPDGYRDNGSTPNGIVFKLCTSHVHVENVNKFAWDEIASGRSDSGNGEEAWKNLLVEIKDRSVNVNEEILKSLPRKD